jgi:hypothetical protein
MPNKNKKILAEEWFKKARDDYKSAKVVFNHKACEVTFSHHNFCCHVSTSLSH